MGAHDGLHAGHPVRRALRDAMNVIPATPAAARAPRTARRKRWWLLASGLLALAVFSLAFQGRRGLWEPDEGRYTSVAAQMVTSGDWIHPAPNNHGRLWSKPPLTYWAIAVSLETFGWNAFAARLPNALAFAATIATLAALGTVFLRRATSLAAVIYATSLLPCAASNVVTADTLLALWETVAVACYARAHFGRGGSRWPVLAMWAAFGVAFATKGPPGLLPLAAILVFRRVVARRGENPSLRWPTGLLVAGAIGLWWYVVVVLENRALSRHVLWNEVVLRIFSSHHDRNGQWYAVLTVYGPVLLLGTLPWTLALARAGRASHALLRTGGWRALSTVEPKLLFLALWFLVPLCVFVFARSRMPLYLLPSFAPLALAAAAALEQRGFAWTRRTVVPVACWAAALLGLRYAVAEWPTERDASRLARQIAALHPEPVSEIVFVSTTPYLGLRLHLGAEVSEIVVESEPGRRKYDVAREIAEGRHPQLWLVTPGEVADTLAHVREAGAQLERLGTVEGWRRYEVFALAD